MSGKRVNLLKDRAKVFLELAEELRGRGRLDLAMFNVDQAFQLRVKATMLRLLGVIPRIHGVRGLLGMLARRLEELSFRGEAREIMSFIRRFREVLIDVESAHVESRYGLFSTTSESVDEAVKVAGELFKLLDRVERDVLG